MLRKGWKKMAYEMDREADDERPRPGGEQELLGEVIVRGDGGGF